MNINLAVRLIGGFSDWLCVVDYSILNILSFGTVQTPLDFEETSFILTELNLINHIERVCQHSKNHIQKEERANQDKQHAKDDAHPPDVGVHQIVHDGCPLLKCDHLEDSEHGPG